MKAVNGKALDLTMWGTSCCQSLKEKDLCWWAGTAQERSMEEKGD